MGKTKKTARTEDYYPVDGMNLLSAPGIMCATAFFLLICLGDGFSIESDAAQRGVLQLFLALCSIWVIVTGTPFKTWRIRQLKCEYWIICILPAFIIGLIKGNPLESIRIDFTPFVYMVVTAWLISCLSVAGLNNLMFAMYILSIIAAIKAIYISLNIVDVSWLNYWQASKMPQAWSNFSRVILRGGDIYIVVALIIGNYIIYRTQSTQVLLTTAISQIVLLVAVAISLTRSNFVGLAFGAVLQFGLISYYSVKSSATRKGIRLKVVSLLVLALASPLIYSQRTVLLERFQKGTDAESSVERRFEENNEVLEISRGEIILGLGLGSELKYEFSQSLGVEEASRYVHNFVFWGILKLGLLVTGIGLLLIYRIFLGGIRSLRISSSTAENKALVITLISILLTLVVVSVGANKLTIMPGAMMLALICEGLNITSRSHRRLEAK
jgi:hypothetical protein